MTDDSYMTDRRRARLPVGFEADALILSERELCAKYGLCRKTCARYRQWCGYLPRRKPTTLPDDFREVSRGKTITEIARHYGTDTKAVRRWYAKAGIKQFYRGGYNIAPAPLLTKRDDSPAGRAVDECLRRLAPTYRCDDTGRANPKGTYWRHGRVVLSDAEVISRAERKGWSADAWRALAA